MHRVSVLFQVVVILAALTVVGGSASVAAQDATPGTGVDQFPISPDPAECRVSPRSTDELIALWFGPEGSPVTAPTAPVTEEAPTSVTIPVGASADEATVAGVVATVREVFACFEAGDFPRATALFTDDLVRSFGPDPGTSEEEARAFLEATPEPETEEEASQILAISDVMLLAGGRVGAFVIDREEEGTNVAYVIFERQGDRWLVDELFEFDFDEDEDEEE